MLLGELLEEHADRSLSLSSEWDLNGRQQTTCRGFIDVAKAAIERAEYIPADGLESDVYLVRVGGSDDIADIYLTDPPGGYFGRISLR